MIEGRKWMKSTLHSLITSSWNAVESHDLKLKKCNNRKFDKLVSLIQYMVSSSEKVIKYISSTNF